MNRRTWVDGKAERRLATEVGPADGMGWHVRGACGPGVVELFFPAVAENASVKARRDARAKAVCAACPVRWECWEHALVHPEHFGVWGGLNERELAAERRRRAQLP